MVYTFCKPWVTRSGRHRDNPYEMTLNSLSQVERRLWASRVSKRIEPLASEHRSISVLAGKRYREFLMPDLMRLFD